MTLNRVFRIFTRPLCLFAILIATSSGCRKSVVYLEKQRIRHANQDVEALYSVPADCSCLTLDDIIRIALVRNLDLMVQEQEYEIQREISTREAFRILPSINLNGTLSKRNKNTGASSQSLEFDIPPAPPSISSEKHDFTWDFGFLWNLLDFGVAYFRANQETNRALLRELDYERARHTIILRVVNSFWKAQISRFAVEAGKPLIEEIVKQENILKSQVERRLVSTLDASAKAERLLQKRILINGYTDINLQLGYKKEYENSMYELATLMGFPPELEFSLCDVQDWHSTTELDDLCEMESLALVSRPELYNRDVDEAISRDEVRIALVQMLPGFSLFADRIHDSNKFLVHRYWNNIGIRLAWDLLAEPNRYFGVRVGQEQVKGAKMARLALSLGAISQVNLAKIQYDELVDQFRVYTQLQNADQILADSYTNESVAGKRNKIDLLEYLSTALVSKINARKIYSQTQIALEQLNYAIGIPRYYTTDNITTEIAEISKEMDCSKMMKEYD